MKKAIITLTILVIMSGIIGLSLTNIHQTHYSVLNAALNNGVLYADGLPGDSDSLYYPKLPPTPPIK